ATSGCYCVRRSVERSCRHTPHDGIRTSGQDGGDGGIFSFVFGEQRREPSTKAGFFSDQPTSQAGSPGDQYRPRGGQGAKSRGQLGLLSRGFDASNCYLLGGHNRLSIGDGSVVPAQQAGIELGCPQGEGRVLRWVPVLGLPPVFDRGDQSGVTLAEPWPVEGAGEEMEGALERVQRVVVAPEVLPPAQGRAGGVLNLFHLGLADLL